MGKKASSLSVNTIVVAAIALLILVVLILIFTGRISIFSLGVKSCSAQKGICAGSSNPDPNPNPINGHTRYGCGDDYATIYGTDCDPNKDDTDDFACCIPIYPDLTPTPVR